MPQFRDMHRSVSRPHSCYREQSGSTCDVATPGESQERCGRYADGDPLARSPVILAASASAALVTSSVTASRSLDVPKTLETRSRSRPDAPGHWRLQSTSTAREVRRSWKGSTPSIDPTVARIPMNDAVGLLREPRERRQTMTDLPIACTLTPDALRARRRDSCRICCSARKAARTSQRACDFDLRRPGETLWQPLLARSTPAFCCRFFASGSPLNPTAGPVFLELTGPPRNPGVHWRIARSVTAHLAIFAVAAFFEIAGCFAFWMWLRRGVTPFVALLGIASLIGFAVALSRVDSAFAGRASHRVQVESTSRRRSCGYGQPKANGPPSPTSSGRLSQ